MRPRTLEHDLVWEAGPSPLQSFPDPAGGGLEHDALSFLDTIPTGDRTFAPGSPLSVVSISGTFGLKPNSSKIIYGSSNTSNFGRD